MARHCRTLRPFQGVVVVVVAVLFGEVKLAATDIDNLLPDGKELCENPVANSTTCSIEVNNVSETCMVYQLPEGNCFNIWNCAQNYPGIKDLNFNQTFDETRNVTSLTLENYKESILLLKTVQEDEQWWQVNLPDGKHNVTIVDLPGRLSKQSPIMIPKPQIGDCEPCPPPLFKWISYKDLHMFQFVVSSTHNISNVTIKIYGTNETDWIHEDCERPEPIPLSARISGQKNKMLTAEELYSKGHCFVIDVNFSSGREGSYTCLKYEDMTASQYEAARAPIDVPVWWIIVLVWVIVCLVVASFVPLIIHKGLLRVHCKGFGRGMQRRSHTSPYNADKGSDQLPESLAILEDAIAPTAPHLRHADADESPLQIIDLKIMETEESKIMDSSHCAL